MMKIVNPLYDRAFKYMMQNNRIAKKVLSVLLEEAVEELELNQQEVIVPIEKYQFTLFRLDFKAVIRTQDGKTKKVLIELQKSKYETDIQRFRAYLGSNYLQPEIEVDEEGKDKKVAYPIITIYILGYNLQEVPYLAVKVDRSIINVVDKQNVAVDSPFIERLTHQSHIIQIRRLPKKRRTRLEQFLSLFNQAWCTEKKYILNLENIPAEFSDIAQYLEGPVMDEEFRKQLEVEEEIDDLFNEQESKYLIQLKAERLKTQLANQKAEQEKQKAEQARQALLNSARTMKKYGIVVEVIQAETGLSLEEIQAL